MVNMMEVLEFVKNNEVKICEKLEFIRLEEIKIDFCGDVGCIGVYKDISDGMEMECGLAFSYKDNLKGDGGKIIVDDELELYYICFDF